LAYLCFDCDGKIKNNCIFAINYLDQMALYESESFYIAATTDDLARLDRLKQIIVALENQMIIAAGDVNIADYSLNDGQVTIRTAYRDPTTIARAIDRFEFIYNRLASRLSNTNIVSLRDAKSFNLRQRY